MSCGPSDAVHCTASHMVTRLEVVDASKSMVEFIFIAGPICSSGLGTSTTNGDGEWTNRKVIEALTHPAKYKHTSEKWRNRQVSLLGHSEIIERRSYSVQRNLTSTLNPKARSGTGSSFWTRRGRSAAISFPQCVPRPEQRSERGRARVRERERERHTHAHTHTHTGPKTKREAPRCLTAYHTCFNDELMGEY